MPYKTIHQTHNFSTKPEVIYELLLTSKGHSAFTGSPAKITNKLGENFTAWDGYITGKNLELVEGQKIVQLWRAEEEGWPAEHFSKLEINLQEINGETKLNLIQSEIPTGLGEQIKQGWIDYYWKPLEEYLAKY